MAVKDRIREEAVRIIRAHPEGIRYADLQRQIHELDSQFKMKNIAASIWDLHDRVPEVEKPSRGLQRITVADADRKVMAETVVTAAQEEAFY